MSSIITRSNLLALCAELELPLLDLQRIVAAYGAEQQQNVYAATDELDAIFDFLGTDFVDDDSLTDLQAIICAWASEEVPASKRPLAPAQLDRVIAVSGL